MADYPKPELDFIVIGAMKAATTWVQAQMSQHPDIFVPEIEPHFFTRDHKKGWQWYRDLFPATKPEGALWGEKTADYLAPPEAAEHIKREYPDAKLIVQFRNPIDRAYSDYKMVYRRGVVKGPPDEYMMSLDNPQPRFLNGGLYGKHMARWFDMFPKEQILCFTFEDVKQRPQETLEKVWQHIGANPHFDSEFAKKRQNDSSEELLPLPVRKALAPIKPLVKPLRNSALFKSTRGMFAREINYPPLSQEMRAHLADFYAEDVALLEKLLDRDLSSWLNVQERADAA
ncbi:sulfotransferase [Erythrobacter sp. YT30]|uniref:sulfotransferase family protein n=1 Tax=Erythrobacter sp. YT30 TaxID=1735012 RepID=UPI00076CDF2C|nr:sulfotransferase [Erythrobacter sp. YT30]KWV92898.1 hypothetical protein AUC45_01760 [Erythrobacter sp. YT30]